MTEKCCDYCQCSEDDYGERHGERERGLREQTQQGWAWALTERHKERGRAEVATRHSESTTATLRALEAALQQMLTNGMEQADGRLLVERYSVKEARRALARHSDATAPAEAESTTGEPATGSISYQRADGEWVTYHEGEPAAGSWTERRCGTCSFRARIPTCGHNNWFEVTVAAGVHAEDCDYWRDLACSCAAGEPAPQGRDGPLELKEGDVVPLGQHVMIRLREGEVASMDKDNKLVIKREAQHSG